MTRSIWKGVLSVGTFTVPVVLLNANDPHAGVEFNQAHRCTKKTFSGIKQKKWCPTCEKEVASAELARVFEHAKGQYLEVTDAELEACEQAASPALAITTVIDGPVTPAFIDTTAYLVGDGPAAGVALETIRVALGTRTAIGEVVIRKRSVRVAMQVMEPAGFVAHVLRSHDQVRALELPAIATLPPARSEILLAKQLLATLAGPFDYDGLPDAYTARVKTMLARKIAGARTHRAPLERATQRRRKTAR